MSKARKLNDKNVSTSLGEIFDAPLRYVTHDDGTFSRAQELCETELRSCVRQSSGAV